MPWMNCDVCYSNVVKKKSLFDMKVFTSISCLHVSRKVEWIHNRDFALGFIWQRCYTNFKKTYPYLCCCSNNLVLFSLWYLQNRKNKLQYKGSLQFVLIMQFKWLRDESSPDKSTLTISTPAKSTPTKSTPNSTQPLPSQPQVQINPMVVGNR